ncbi:MAG: hypothetical protein C0490_15195 [Marivirga sp.]|nr:hypothetical protein [Marivirga sp.]
MIIKSRIKEKVVNAAMILFLFLCAGIYSCSAQAQSFRPIKYMGFEVAFGVRAFNINSNIAAINDLAVVEEGGSLGLIFGNDYLRGKIRAAGFYYSGAKVPRTVDLFESEGLINFYPLQYLRKSKAALDIYLIGGVTVDNIKFYGHYLNDDKAKINYSVTNEPYLGKRTQVNATGGIGLEYQLPMEYDFVHLFAEAKYAKPFQSSSNNESFRNTTTSDLSSISVGVSFGIIR